MFYAISLKVVLQRSSYFSTIRYVYDICSLCKLSVCLCRRIICSGAQMTKGIWRMAHMCEVVWQHRIIPYQKFVSATPTIASVAYALHMPCPSSPLLLPPTLALLRKWHNHTPTDRGGGVTKQPQWFARIYGLKVTSYHLQTGSDSGTDAENMCSWLFCICFF